ncbi:hypothetical protein [Streptomyces erythrochromogenes]|uniref:hypothetical protein n=1 Tax=Streptomyces erythrochromogenes TaxID=285574 RepID=UPI00386B9F76|nr:hypothetical protein OG364_26750 [Streptomyces erythrochromogenes]
MSTDHLDGIPYEETTDGAYAVTAARTFSVQRPSKGFTLLNGDCPRCRGTLSVPLVSDVLRQGEPPSRRRGILRWAAGTRRSRPAPYETVRCNCRLPHSGRPENRRGCGAYWNVYVAPQEQP